MTHTNHKHTCSRGRAVKRTLPVRLRRHVVILLYEASVCVAFRLIAWRSHPRLLVRPALWALSAAHNRAHVPIYLR
jgi:hypothetical protein